MLSVHARIKTIEGVEDLLPYSLGSEGSVKPLPMLWTLHGQPEPTSFGKSDGLYAIQVGYRPLVLSGRCQLLCEGGWKYVAELVSANLKPRPGAVPAGDVKGQWNRPVDRAVALAGRCSDAPTVSGVKCPVGFALQIVEKCQPLGVVEGVFRSPLAVVEANGILVKCPSNL